MRWLPPPKLTVFALLLVGGGFLLTPEPTYAIFGQIGNLIGSFADATIGNALVSVLQVFKNLLVVSLKLVAWLFEAAITFDNFYTDGVNNAWRATRDFANLFFSFIILFIAISTALNIPQLQAYHAKKMLPQFIVLALLINFSRAIVGVVIDISQLLMVQFYNASVGSSQTIGDRIGEFTEVSGMLAAFNGTGNFKESLAFLLVIIFLALLISVLIWSATILLTRLVVLWVVIALAPLAFTIYFIPPLKQYFGRWSNALTKNAINGPIILFFLWLSFTVLEGTGSGINTSPELTFDGLPEFFESTQAFDFILMIVFISIANTQAMNSTEHVPNTLKGGAGFLSGAAVGGIGGYLGGSKRGMDTFGEVASKADRRSGLRRGRKLASKTGPGRRLRKGGRKFKENLQEGQALGKSKGRLQGAANTALQNIFGGQEGEKKAQEQYEEKFDIKQFKKQFKKAQKGDIDYSEIDPERFKAFEKASNNRYEEEAKDIYNPEQLGNLAKKAKEDNDIVGLNGYLKQAEQVRGGQEAVLEQLGYNKEGGAEEYSRLFNNEIEQGVDPQQLKEQNSKLYGQLQNRRTKAEYNLREKAGNYAGSGGLADSQGYFTKNPNLDNLEELAKDENGNIFKTDKNGNQKPIETSYIKRDPQSGAVDWERSKTPFTQSISKFEPKKKLASTPENPDFFLNTDNQGNRIKDNKGNAQTNAEYETFINQLREKDLYDSKKGEFKNDVTNSMSPDQQRGLLEVLQGKTQGTGSFLSPKEKYLYDILKT